MKNEKTPVTPETPVTPDNLKLFNYAIKNLSITVKINSEIADYINDIMTIDYINNLISISYYKMSLYINPCNKNDLSMQFLTSDTYIDFEKISFYCFTSSIYVSMIFDKTHNNLFINIENIDYLETEIYS